VKGKGGPDSEDQGRSSRTKKKRTGAPQNETPVGLGKEKEQPDGRRVLSTREGETEETEPQKRTIFGKRKSPTWKEEKNKITRRAKLSTKRPGEGGEWVSEGKKDLGLMNGGKKKERGKKFLRHEVRFQPRPERAYGRREASCEDWPKRSG